MEAAPAGARRGWVVRKLRTQVAAVLAVVVASAALAEGQTAPDEAARQEARTIFERGVTLMRNENWEAAAAEFERSLAAYPTRSALFNLAMCRKAVHSYRQALLLLRRWEADYAAAASEEERQAVAEAVDEMQQLLGLLVIRVDPAGATVALDGEALGAGPFDAPVPVDVGRHVVEASLAGYEPSRQDVTVGTLQTVEVVLGLRPVVEPPSAAVPPAEEGRKINQAWFWTTAGTAVASGVAAAVTGGLTYAAFQDFAAGGHVDRGLADEGEALETTTNVLAGVAGAAAAAALVLAFFTDFGAGEEPPAAAPASALVWPGGLAVVW